MVQYPGDRVTCCSSVGILLSDFLGSHDCCCALQVGLFSCNVLQIHSDGFEATFWITVRWTDVRLSWDSQLYNGTLRRNPGELWEPYVYVANMISSSANAVISETVSTVERYECGMFPIPACVVSAYMLHRNV